MSETTVDAVDSGWKTPAGVFTLVDTAGIRRQAHFKDESEFYASMRAIHGSNSSQTRPVRTCSTMNPARPSAPVHSASP